jgi:aspartate/methionine/tyrosine aminotransferase
MRPVARRLAGIAPFRVMDILARARALEAQGRHIVHMEIGEPDFPTAEGIVEAGLRALREGRTHYTETCGLPALRAAIAAHYAPAACVEPERVVVTPGASGALQLVLAAVVDPGDRVLMADPGYPCNRHLVHLYGGEPVGIPVDAASGYQLDRERVDRHWDARTAAVLIASPANPTGTVIAPETLREIAELVRARGGVLIVDEIYHGLIYDGAPATSALALDDEVFVVNSFSKYYGMTGWRLGWLVAPRAYVPAIEKLAQNLFIAPSTPAQYAALAAFCEPVRAELERRRAAFQRRRDYLLPALRDLGFDIPITPQGAFYLYSDCTRFTADSEAFARALLEEAGVAITPGTDFGTDRAREHVRFSYANTLENLTEGVRRIKAFLAACAQAV